MKKQTSIINRIIPSWMKFRKVAEPIRVRKITDVLDDLVKESEAENNSKITKVIKSEDREKDTKTEKPVSDTTDTTKSMSKTEGKTEKSLLDKLQNRITSVNDDLGSNLTKSQENAENDDKNAKNSEKTDKNAEKSEKNEDIEQSEIKSEWLTSSGNSDSDRDTDSKDNEKSETFADFEKEIEKIQNKYKDKTDYDYYKDLLPEIKESLGLSEVDNIEIDEDKIREEVKSRLTKKSDEEKSKLKADTETAVKKLIEQAEAEKELANEKQSKIAESYGEAKESVSMDALKRGLQRSSIVLQKVAEIDSKKAEELVTIQKELASSLQKSNDKINSLEQFLDESLANSETELASEIESEIALEIESLKEKQQEVEKFNNNVKKLEAEYQLKLADKKQEAEELKSKLAEEYKGVASKTRKDELVKACKDYFAGQKKTEALTNFYSSDLLKNVLGDRYYDVYYYIVKNCKK